MIGKKLKEVKIKKKLILKVFQIKKIPTKRIGIISDR
jgi:hypothetical protein